MQPNSEHAFYAWLIVIAAVCIVTLIGAIIDRFFLNRRIRQQTLNAVATQREAQSNSCRRQQTGF